MPKLPKTPNLDKYIARINIWAGLTNHPLLSVATLTRVEADRIFAGIEGELSPENLSCDGTLSRTKINAKRAYYNHVISDLQQLGFNT